MPGEFSVWSEFRTGNRSAYEQVIRDYYQDLYAYGIRLVQNPDFVKDCVHDLFVYIWDRRTHLGDTDDVRLYLLKSLRNRVIKQTVKEARLTALEDIVGDPDFPDWSVEDEIFAHEDSIFTKNRLKIALQALPTRQREVVHLRFYEGFSNERIAGMMNISKPAVANLVHATLKNLRQIWHASKFLLLFLSIL